MLVAITTIVVALVYLTSNKKNRRKQVFERHLVSKDICIIASKESHPAKRRERHDIAVTLGHGIFDVVFLSSSKAIVALIGNDTQSSGIYIYQHTDSNTINLNKIYSFELQKNYKTFEERRMAFDGLFYESEHFITFTCQHFPIIYIIDKEHLTCKALKTKGNIPPPSIKHVGDYYIFDRRQTCNSNFSSFVIDSMLYVFPNQEGQNNIEYVVDCYTLNTQDYRHSFVIANKIHEGNEPFVSISIRKDTVFLQSQKCLTTFKLKRHERI